MIDFYRYTDKEIKELLKSMIVIMDSREQQASHITKWFDDKKISYRVEKLETADYSFLLPANLELGIMRDLYFSDKISIERKANLEELSGNFTNDRTRIESEFIRHKGKMILLIEKATYEDIVNHNYKTDYQPTSYLATLHSFSERYNIPFTFMKENKHSGEFIYRTFYYWLRNYLLNR